MNAILAMPQSQNGQAVWQKTQPVLRALLLFGLFFVFLAGVQFVSPDLVGNDGYYHIKMAYMLRQQGLKPPFPYLPFTILDEQNFVNHHFLYHVLLIPFTFGDLLLGAKWGAVLFTSLSFLAVYLLLNSQRIPYAALWSLALLVVSEAFLFRMSMTRTQAASFGVLVIALYLLFNRRWRGLIGLGLLYVWLYNAFPLLLVIAAAYTVSMGLLEKRIELRPLLYSLLGIGLGIVINPYFPINLEFMVAHIFPKVSDPTAISVGSEWYPYNTHQLLENSPGMWILLILALWQMGVSKKPLSVPVATLFWLTIFFEFLLFRSRRFIEYAPAFVVLFSAFAWKPFFENALESFRLPENIFRVSLSPKTIQNGLGLLLLLILIPSLILNFAKTRKAIQAGIRPAEQFAQASAWLIQNTPKGERVFHTDWDDFPRLFFHNTHNTYIVGLDPVYMQEYDPKLYQLYEEVTQGRVENPSQDILEKFGAKYVITDLNHKSFINQARQDPNMRVVYKDENSMVFMILPR
ncbi:MAG: hypothetical protein RML93_08970 [Anaerolineales bacterium]|nr:glycosyltransferase family 39 protein [Anaerolineales bacterium]MDW8447405.1 hypothetical protein [Anaerolineales bacterium]